MILKSADGGGVRRTREHEAKQPAAWGGGGLQGFGLAEALKIKLNGDDFAAFRLAEQAGGPPPKGGWGRPARIN